MFESLFTGRRTLETYRAAPLLDCRVRYLGNRAESGANVVTLRTIAVHQLRLVLLLDFAEGDTVSLGQIKAAAEEWSCPGLHRIYKPSSSRRRADFVGQVVQWLRFLGMFEESDDVKHAHTAEVGAYEDWMRDERGFSEASIYRYCSYADEFLEWLGANDLTLGSVRITDIDRAIAAKQTRRRYSRWTIRNYAVGLRTFFRFAERQRWCTQGMAEGIIPPRNYATESVPLGPTRDDVQLLLASTERGRPMDKRDRAILMILIAYGLRSGEVCGLQLNDVDWENERLRVRRSKSGRTHFYPLSRGVGQAIIRYVLEVRPPLAERTLFVTVRAPFRPLSPSGMAEVVRSRFERLGIVARRMGPHGLRHAAAQHLLDQGMSMKVVGDFLGHRHPSSTGVYAKVDLSTLREVADFDLEVLA